MTSSKIICVLLSAIVVVSSQECTFNYSPNIPTEFQPKVFTKKPTVSLESCARLCHNNAFCTSATFKPGLNGNEDFCSLSFFEIDCGLQYKTGSKDTPKPNGEVLIFCLSDCKGESSAASTKAVSEQAESTTSAISSATSAQTIKQLAVSNATIAPKIESTTKIDSASLQNVGATAKTKLSVISSVGENRKPSELDRNEATKKSSNKTAIVNLITTKRPTSAPITARVESIFSDLSKGFYKLYGTPVTAMEANGRCLRDGGFLPRFSDKSQFDAFVHWRNKHEANIDHTELWLDGQNFTTGKWMWNDMNNTPVGLNLWAPIPVREALKQNCLVLGSNIAKEYEHFYATDCESIQKYACFFKGANSEDPDSDKFTRSDSSIGKSEFLSTLWSPPTTTPSIGLSEDDTISHREGPSRSKRHLKK